MAQQSIKDFENQLEEFGLTLRKMDVLLLNVSGRIVDRMKQRAPIDTGELRRSIRAEITKNSVIFKMLVYGAYQNYGVRGTQDTRGKEVELGIEPRPEKEPFYQFKKRRFGLKSRNFFNFNEINNEIVDYIEKNLIDE